MNQETRQSDKSPTGHLDGPVTIAPGARLVGCQNCKQEFVIEPEDFDFYEKMKVPAPTFCPECRTIRRMMIRNERALYKKKCGAPGHSEDLISIYSPDKKCVVYDQKFWWSDKWDPLLFGMEYDFKTNFFTQFRKLWETVPLIAVSNSNEVNSEYCNVADQSKDSYMTSGSFKIEKTLYSNRVYVIKDSADLYACFRDELCYENIYCNDSYRLFFSKLCVSCIDSWFLYDCKNCSHCFGCTNLRNRQYCIWNEQYSKDEYFLKIKEFDLSSAKNISLFKEQFKKLYFKAIHKYATILKSVNVTGDAVENAKNCKMCFDITEGAEDCKYIHWGGIQEKDIYDSGPGCGDSAELMYETVDSGLHGSNIAFTNVVYGSQNVRYALFCHDCVNIFGCISLRNKQYCILNKQYTKEEYEALVPKIIEHMNNIPYIDKNVRTYKYGEFFPFELAPFAYNESIARDYFPITKSEAVVKGYPWHDYSEKQYNITLQAAQIPDTISTVEDDILNQVIGCDHARKCDHQCTTAFKLTREELNFYRRMNFPIPKLCPNCRHYERLAQRNPMKLWHRQCMCNKNHSHHTGRCSNEFETSYAPDRKEIIYCESCYNAEVA